MKTKRFWCRALAQVHRVVAALCWRNSDWPLRRSTSPGRKKRSAPLRYLSLCSCLSWFSSLSTARWSICGWSLAGLLRSWERTRDLCATGLSARCSRWSLSRVWRSPASSYSNWGSSSCGLWLCHQSPRLCHRLMSFSALCLQYYF